MSNSKKFNLDRSTRADPPKSQTVANLLLWALISVGLWYLLPQRFTQTDGPGGIFTMIVVGVIGLIGSVICIMAFKSVFLKR